LLKAIFIDFLYVSNLFCILGSRLFPAERLTDRKPSKCKVKVIPLYDWFRNFKDYLELDFIEQNNLIIDVSI
jgi:hypothetical protein